MYDTKNEKLESLESFYNKVKEERKGYNKISTSNDVVSDNVDMHLLKHEIFRVLFLDSSNNKIDILEIEGISSQCVVHVKKIIEKTINTATTAIIILHNHPGGNKDFSESDKQITRKIYVACKSMDLKLLDHVLMYGDGHLSMVSGVDWDKVSKSIY